MLRLFPCPGMSIEWSQVLRVSVAGAESNVAAGLARLGVPVTWISKLPRTAIGRRVVAELRAAGVDTSHVVWAEEGRVGLYFTQQGAAPDEIHVWYDRKDSAFSTLTPEEVPWDVIRSARHVHLTGITPALGEGPRSVVLKAVRECRSAGVTVSFDVNYRSKLWAEEQARRILEQLLPEINLVICSERDAARLFGLPSGARAVYVLRDRFSADVVVVTLGEKGALAWDGQQLRVARTVSSPVVDRIGRGDAFDAGVIYGYLKGDLQEGLDIGVRYAALAQTRWGDVPWVCEEEVRRWSEESVVDHR